MSSYQKAPAAAPNTPSERRLEIVALMTTIGPDASVDDWSSHNGITVCATATQPNCKVVRCYIEGVSTVALGERGVLAAVKAILGVP